MSETVKLIIEIPKEGAFECDIYTPICEEGFIRDEYNEKVAEAIKNGIPLDDVKAEIKRMEYHMIDCEVFLSQDEVLDILDNIGKGDKE